MLGESYKTPRHCAGFNASEALVSDRGAVALGKGTTAKRLFPRHLRTHKTLTDAFLSVNVG